MTIIIETFIICNGDMCHENYGVDFRGRTSASQRRNAKVDGWTVVLGLDYCNKCSNIINPLPDTKQ